MLSLVCLLETAVEMLDAIKDRPLRCGVSEGHDSVLGTDLFEILVAPGDGYHVFVRIPLVLHTTLNVELFLDPEEREEPDFLIGKNTAAESEISDGVKKSINSIETYKWLDMKAKPLWNPDEPDASLTHFLTWLKQCWLAHQKQVFCDGIVATNERLQFEYAAFLQGFSADDVVYNVQRQDNRSIATIGIKMYTGDEEQRKWRQLLFRVASTTLSFDTEAERQALITRLEDWKRRAPIQLQYCCVLVIRDDDGHVPFNVARESIQLQREGGESSKVHVELLSGETHDVELSPLLSQLEEEMERLFPLSGVNLNQSLPKLAVDRNAHPGSFIDHLPNLEQQIVDVWGAELYHWFDVVACFTSEFGVPLICHSASVTNEGSGSRSALFHVVETQSQLGAVLHIVSKSSYQVPEITLTSSQHCLRGDGGPLRIAVQLNDTEGKPKVMKVVGGRQVVDPVMLSDETKAFLEKVFPKFVQACYIHSKDAVTV